MLNSMIEEGEEGTETTDTFDAKAKWKKMKHTLKFASHLLLEHSSLGPRVAKDCHAAVCPAGFKVPPNLNRVTVDIELPVGFNRLKYVMLDSKSNFYPKQFLEDKLKNADAKFNAWDCFDDHIGCYNPKDINEEDFIGATRKYQYLMPKSVFVSANTAHVTSTIIEYNDYCFGIKMITKNPEVPFGKKFEAHTQQIFVNRGNYRCKMVCSMEAVFPGSKPMVAWKIKNAMFSGCLASDVAFGELVCKHAGSE